MDRAQFLARIPVYIMEFDRSIAAEGLATDREHIALISGKSITLDVRERCVAQAVVNNVPSYRVDHSGPNGAILKICPAVEHAKH